MVQAAHNWVTVLQYSAVAAQSVSTLHPQWLGRPRMQALSEVGPQVSLQALQFSVVPRPVSQPLESVASQLSQPKSQESMWQEPPSQDAVAWAREQGLLQEPQSLSVSSEASQPLESVPSQLSHNESQESMWQEPPAQEALAWAREQEVPQEPQLLSVSRDCSQPLESVPSQSSHSESQVSIWQLPVLQVAVAWAREQGVSQAPQCCMVFKRVSQPLPSLPSQSPQPELQESMWQEPPVQEAVALVREQGLLHEPQLESVCSEVSQPLESLPSQLPHRETQEAMRQVPPEQVAVAWARVQAVPHEPQSLVVSREVSQPLESVPSQSSHSESQVSIWQLPVLQVAVAWARLQEVLQAPQCCREFRRVSQPLLSMPSQSPQPLSQVSMRQLPPSQVAEAWARVQAEPQEPQSVSVCRDVSQPLESVASQLAHRLLQDAMRQLPPVQVAVAWAREQVVPQEPQSLVVSNEVSQPFRSIESQSSQRVLQDWIRQLPVAQVGVAWARQQIPLHCPQSSRVLRGVSQPLPSLPSQSPHSESQLSIRQEQVAQVGVAWAREQADPQVAQFCRVFSAVSQPLSSVASQLPQQ